MTTVVHVRDVLDRLKAGDPEVVYIGRAMPRWGLKGSPFANHLRIGVDGIREEVIAMYRRSITENLPDCLPGLRALRGKTLACWCKPDACHGDVLAELAEAAA